MSSNWKQPKTLEDKANADKLAEAKQQAKSRGQAKGRVQAKSRGQAKINAEAIAAIIQLTESYAKVASLEALIAENMAKLAFAEQKLAVSEEKASSDVQSEKPDPNRPIDIVAPKVCSKHAADSVESISSKVFKENEEANQLENSMSPVATESNIASNSLFKSETLEASENNTSQMTDCSFKAAKFNDENKSKIQTMNSNKSSQQDAGSHQRLNEVISPEHEVKHQVPNKSISPKVHCKADQQNIENKKETPIANEGSANSTNPQIKAIPGECINKEQDSILETIKSNQKDLNRFEERHVKFGLNCDNYLWVHCGSWYNKETDMFTFRYYAQTITGIPVEGTSEFHKQVFYSPKKEVYLVQYLGNSALGCTGKEQDFVKRSAAIFKPALEPAQAPAPLKETSRDEIASKAKKSYKSRFQRKHIRSEKVESSIKLLNQNKEGDIKTSILKKNVKCEKESNMQAAVPNLNQADTFKSAIQKKNFKSENVQTTEAAQNKDSTGKSAFVNKDVKYAKVSNVQNTETNKNDHLKLGPQRAKVYDTKTTSKRVNSNKVLNCTYSSLGFEKMSEIETPINIDYNFCISHLNKNHKSDPSCHPNLNLIDENEIFNQQSADQMILSHHNLIGEEEGRNMYHGGVKNRKENRLIIKESSVAKFEELSPNKWLNNELIICVKCYQ